LFIQAYSLPWSFRQREKLLRAPRKRSLRANPEDLPPPPAEAYPVRCINETSVRNVWTCRLPHIATKPHPYWPFAKIVEHTFQSLLTLAMPQIRPRECLWQKVLWKEDQLVSYETLVVQPTS